MLEVENIQPGHPLHAPAVLLVVGHDLVVAGDAQHFDLCEDAEQFAQLTGRIFAHMPRIARERHGGVGRGDDEPSAGTQHPVYFADELRILLDVLDDLERNHAVELPVGERQRRYGGLPEHNAGKVGEVDGRKVLVDGDETCGLGRHGFDAVARPGADFEHVAPDAFGGGMVGQQRALEHEIVGSLARHAFGGLDLCHYLRIWMPRSFISTVPCLSSMPTDRLNVFLLMAVSRRTSSGALSSLSGR